MKPNSARYHALTAWLLATPLWAQTLPDAGRLLLEQQQPAIAAPNKPVIELPARQDAGAYVLPEANGLSFEVKSYRLSSDLVLAQSELDDLLADFTGSAMTLADLQLAVNRVTLSYRKRGYFLAQAYLPPQDVQNGIVLMNVLEGRLGDVRIENNTDLDSAAFESFLSDLKAQKILIEGNLERSLLVLNSLPGVQIQSTLKPGASVGLTDLDIRVNKAETYSSNVSLDNYGSSAIGKWRLGGQFNVNNPFKRHDALNVRVSTSGAHFSYARLAYQFAVGGSGAQLGGAYSSMRYKLGESFTSLDASGTADVTSAYVLYPLLRLRSNTVMLQANADHKKLVDEQRSTATLSDKAADVLTLGLSGQHIDAALGGGFSTWSLSHVQGDLRLDALSAANDRDGLSTNGRYRKNLASITRLQELPALGASWRVLGQLSAQWAGKNLDSSERFALGGPQGVRAYAQGEAFTDQGWLANVELRYAVTPQWTLLSFVDKAKGDLNKHPLAANASQNQRTLAGYGVGANYSATQGVMLSSAIAWHSADAPQVESGRAPRVWLTAQVSF